MSAAGTERLGWIGLGNIGAPMARRLLGHPGGLVVCDVVEEATRPFAAEGAEVAADAAGVVAAGATVISVMVRDDAQVRSVVGALLGTAPAGTLVAVHSTIRAETAEDLALVAARTGVVLVDAPVSGGAMGAATGRLAVLLGGDAAAVERCQAAFAGFADQVVHFGPAGAGTRAKIARNLVTFASFAAVGEALRLAEATGVDLVGLGDVVRHSDAVTGGAGAIMLRDVTAPLAADDGLRPIFEHTLALGSKDLDLALALAADAGLDLPVTAAARRGLATALGLEEPADAP
ncbi:NAD(P)-dependent oxidoreductase [Iamia sp. SCSIO 61187]|uniref:NAD(P)-dependent oxidoreductase n=1 Tax=Iamia sp. SCSIO 61187 TaxID=2722752 RepID=UPI001C63719D|nr:NAD(P)-dependent oxidoreductase [Iamia sp. SCSIO 61187]QYG92170.1 NAD(P)-dependent oxidoreductase [Iamia sp. SCSIO 61187]